MHTFGMRDDTESCLLFSSMDFVLKTIDIKVFNWIVNLNVRANASAQLTVPCKPIHIFKNKYVNKLKLYFIGVFGGHILYDDS